MSEYVFSEVPVAAEVSSAQRATPEQIVGIGKKIWAVINESGVDPKDSLGNDRLLERLQGEYKDFATSFPLVLRWAAQARRFSPRALHKYLMKHAATNLSSRKAFLELQAEYLVFLYREENTHVAEASVRWYREQIVKTLLEEDETFEKMREAVGKEIEAQDVSVDKDRRRRLYELLLAGKISREKQAASEPQAPGGIQGETQAASAGP